MRLRQKSFRFEKLERRTRLGQKCLTPRNKKKFTKITFQIFVNFGLFKKELLLLLPFVRF
ncbi:hypothetical protein [Enterococcus durans]|uniref:hypothetical protein n=1 Tax=Enterococcus durans TaxID=53345 RepID=UPI001157FEE9|nr:hypothetical protein [Enterococcus durans]